MSPSLQRTVNPEQGVVLVAQPFGSKRPAPTAEPFDFDWLYNSVVAPAITDAGFRPERIDGLYGPSGVLDLWWRALCRAEIVVIDLTGRSANVNLELGMALTLGKKIVIITQHREDIPTDIGGLYRYIGYTDKAVDIDNLRKELPANLLALRQEPSQEMTLAPMMGFTDKAPGRIEAVERDYATVKCGDRIGYLRGADVDYSRVIADMRKRFSKGDDVNGAFVFDVARQESRYTLIAGQENPWPQLSVRYSVGTTFTGTVANSIESIGVFVRVLGNICGLVPRNSIGGEWPHVGEDIEVTVATFNAPERRITLQLRRGAGAPSKPVSQPVALPPVGAHFDDAEVVRVQPSIDGRGGYLLLKLKGYSRPAMLLIRDMLEDLADDMENRRVEVGDVIAVEVATADPVSRKVILKDLGDPGETEAGESESVTAAAA